MQALYLSDYATAISMSLVRWSLALVCTCSWYWYFSISACNCDIFPLHCDIFPLHCSTYLHLPLTSYLMWLICSCIAPICYCRLVSSTLYCWMCCICFNYCLRMSTLCLSSCSLNLVACMCYRLPMWCEYA